ncbi:MAG: type II toxin-antitoxin system RelE/ParE family toxin [Nitrosospira sp.]|nr:type II toxin-antitoxin system RelE/ParE family toxin [Nitrosospira sp.]
MAWTIIVDDAAEKDLGKIDKRMAKRITAFMRQRVASLDNPRSIGEPLKSSHGELWRYRVGDFRVICQIQDAALCVLVIRIGNRKEIYR